MSIDEEVDEAVDDGLDTDFAEVSLGSRAVVMLARGVPPLDIADELGVTIDDLKVAIEDSSQARYSLEPTTAREARARIGASVDEIAQRAYAALDQSPLAHDRAELMGVLLGAARVRAELLQMALAEVLP